MTQPSWGFLKRGVTTESDRECIRWLSVLREEFDDNENDDRRDFEALDWALALVADRRKDVDEFQQIERDRDEREEAAYDEHRERLDVVADERSAEEHDRECDCGIEKQDDYEQIRERRGVETHSPYCPVGRREREAS